jgi:hypothetical protein
MVTARKLNQRKSKCINYYLQNLVVSVKVLFVTVVQDQQGC